jgi:hypothetical protein
MKKLAIYSLLLLFVTCAEPQLSHTDTAKIVVESFYTKDNSTLKKHTTEAGYNGLISIQNLVSGEKKASSFEVLDETVEGDTAWVKFTTSYDTKPETFKLVKEKGKWKVTQKGLREKGPF